MKIQTNNEICMECKQPTTQLNLFLCKGKMLCQGCYMTETKGNTLFFNEDAYPRKRDSHGILMNPKITGLIDEE